MVDKLRKVKTEPAQNQKYYPNIITTTRPQYSDTLQPITHKKKLCYLYIYVLT